MEFGKLEYTVVDEGGAEVSLRLTLVGQGDEELLVGSGLAALRRRRIQRLSKEALAQGAVLTYGDLSSLLLSSLATIKRDVRELEKDGPYIPLRGRKKRNGNGETEAARA